MDNQDDENNANNLREARKILKPYRHLFSKPITVKRNDQSKLMFNIDDRNIANSCTQTSKTILELARIDNKNTRERSISPDSLCASPRKVEEFHDKSRPVSETDTIALVKKESTYNFLHDKSTKDQQYVQLHDLPAPPMDQYYDEIDEYTQTESVYTASDNCIDNVLHEYDHPQTQYSNKNNMAAKPNVIAPYPPLYEHQYIVASAHMNQNYSCAPNLTNAHAYQVNSANAHAHQANSANAYAHQMNSANAHAYQENSANAHDNLMSPTELPDSNATATAYLIQQQQLEDKVADAVFPKKSLVNTFLAKSKNRLRYVGDQSDQKIINQSEKLNRNHLYNSFRFKSRSYIDPSSIHNNTGQIQQQNYSNRSKFTLNDYNNQHVYQQPCPDSLRDSPKQFQNNQQIFMEGDLYSNYIPPRNTPVSKTSFGQRRSHSFMLPTIASERRSCMQEVRQITRLLSPTMRGCSLSPRANNNQSAHLCKVQSGSNAGQQYHEQHHQKEQQYYQYQLHMQNQQRLLAQGQHKMKVPYIDGSVCDETISEERNKVYKEKIKDYSPVQLKPVTPKNTFEEDLLKIDQLSLEVKNSLEGNSTGRSNSGTSIDSTINNVLSRIKNEDWNIALKGLAEVTELCRSTDASIMSPHMTAVNQRLLDLLRSPRSHVCRTACQAAGHLFESMKDTRRPEFEDIVTTLLHKTADSNKFIRQDANLALDCMVTHISSFHAIKALCGKGPSHKNPLVRSATIRLIICAVVITGPDNIFNPGNSDYTRKRVIVHLAKFIMDKNLETRKYAERLFKVLNRDRFFDMYVKKFLEKEDLEIFKQNIKYLKK